MAGTESPVSVCLKLLIDTHGKRVLFAEADKDFIDFLFRILSLRFSTVISLLENQQMAGSLSTLYQSIEKLDDLYMQPNKSKDALLKPFSPASGSVPLLGLAPAPIAAKRFYRCTCRQFSLYVTDDPRTLCPSCHQKMAMEISYVAGPGQPGEKAEGVGFVKEMVTYMVMDDLVVTPLSTISSIALLNRFNVKEISSLEEKVVDFGMDEAVKLLDASLRSNKVLTEIFFSRA